MFLYVHRNIRLIRDGEPRTATSPFIQLLSSVTEKQVRCLTSTETVRLIRDGGAGVWRWGKIIYLSLHCHHQNVSCIKRRAAMRAILMFHKL